MTLSNNLFLNLFRRPGQLFRDGLANYQGCRRKSLLLQPGREVGVEAAAGGLQIRRARDRHHQGEVINWGLVSELFIAQVSPMI